MKDLPAEVTEWEEVEPRVKVVVAGKPVAPVVNAAAVAAAPAAAAGVATGPT